MHPPQPLWKHAYALHKAAKQVYAARLHAQKSSPHSKFWKILKFHPRPPSSSSVIGDDLYTTSKRDSDEKGIRTPALSDQRIGLTLSWRLRPLGHLTIDGEHASAHVQESQHPPMRCSGRRITRAGRIGRVVVCSRIQ